MKVRLYSYVHESNGLAVEVVPETSDEEELIAALWKFGQMETGYSETNQRTRCYIVRAFKQATEAKGE